jgi:hypothetical protein
MELAKHAAFTLLAAICLADVWTTHLILKSGGRERNKQLLKFEAWIDSTFGDVSLITAIAIAQVAVLIGLWIGFDAVDLAVTVAFYAVIAAWRGYVVALNLGVILKQRSN